MTGCKHGPDCGCGGCRNFRDGMAWAVSIKPTYGRTADGQPADPDTNADDAEAGRR